MTSCARSPKSRRRCAASRRASRMEPLTEVFRAVGAEIERLLDADTGGLMRYEPNEAVTVLVNHSRGLMPIFAIGSRLPLDGDSVSRRVLRSGRPARLDSYDAAPGDHRVEVAPVGGTLRGRRAGRGRRPAMGGDDRRLEAACAASSGYRGAAQAVRRARRHRDRQRGEPHPADRLARPPGGHLGRGAPAHRARPARRHPAAPRLPRARPARSRGQRAARAARPARRPRPDRAGADRGRGGTAGDLPRPAPRDPLPRRPRTRPADPRPPGRVARRDRGGHDRRLPEQVEVAAYYVVSEASPTPPSTHKPQA